MKPVDPETLHLGPRQNLNASGDRSTAVATPKINSTGSNFQNIRIGYVTEYKKTTT